MGDIRDRLKVLEKAFPPPRSAYRCLILWPVQRPNKVEICGDTITILFDETILDADGNLPCEPEALIPADEPNRDWVVAMVRSVKRIVRLRLDE